MFFSLAFQYRVLLELFDLQDGLRKLFNVVSITFLLLCKCCHVLWSKD